MVKVNFVRFLLISMCCMLRIMFFMLMKCFYMWFAVSSARKLSEVASIMSSFVEDFLSVFDMYFIYLFDFEYMVIVSMFIVLWSCSFGFGKMGFLSNFVIKFIVVSSSVKFARCGREVRFVSMWWIIVVWVFMNLSVWEIIVGMLLFLMIVFGYCLSVGDGIGFGCGAAVRRLSTRRIIFIKSLWWCVCGMGRFENGVLIVMVVVVVDVLCMLVYVLMVW